MKTLPYFAIAAQVVATHPVAVLKLEVTLNSSATAGLYCQVHDAIAAPANGAVPLKSWPAGECAFKEFEMGHLQLTQGLYICLSTTAATKTLAAGGSDLMDALNVELSDPEIPTGTTLVGDLTTPVAGLQVWTEAAGATARKALIALEVDGTNLTTAQQYVQIFAQDTVATGDKPIIMFPIAVGGVLTGANALRFGIGGRDIYSRDSDTPFTARLGCTVKISSTKSTFTACTGTAAIRAEYKNAL